MAKFTPLMYLSNKRAWFVLNGKPLTIKPPNVGPGDPNSSSATVLAIISSLSAEALGVMYLYKGKTCSKYESTA